MLNLPVLLTLRSDGCQVLSYIKEGYSEVAARTERLLDERTYELAHVLVQESPQDLDLAPDPLTVKRPSSSLLYADGHGSDHLHCVPLPSALVHGLGHGAVRAPAKDRSQVVCLSATNTSPSMVIWRKNSCSQWRKLMK